MQKPLVSIIIPSYNAEKFIYNTILSALNQSWENTEIILVDDGSTDNTLSVVKSIGSEKIKILTQENKGASSARNQGLKYAKGDFIQWLDADDILDKYKIERQLKVINYEKETNILLSSAWGTFYHRLKSAEFNPTPLWNDLKPKEWIIYNLKHGYFMANCSWLVSREITEKAGPWNESLTYNDDGEYFFRVVLNSDLIRFTKDSYSYYRKGIESSLSYSIIRNKKSLDSWNRSVLICVENALRFEKSQEIIIASIKSLYRLLNLQKDMNLKSTLDIIEKLKSFSNSDYKIINNSNTFSKAFNFFIKIMNFKNANTLRIIYLKLKIKITNLIELVYAKLHNDKI